METRVNLGSGNKRIGDHINVDLRVLPKTDIGATVTSLPFPSSSVDSIICSDVLEHIPRHAIAAALLEWHRVLKPGGTLKIKTPNLRALAAAFLSGEIDLDEFSRRVYGNQEGNDRANFHKSGMDRESLSKALRFVGFQVLFDVDLEGNDRYNMGIRAVKPEP